LDENRTPIGVAWKEIAQDILKPRWSTNDIESTLLSFGQRVGLDRKEYSEKQLQVMRFVTDQILKEIKPLGGDEFFDFEQYLKSNKKWSEAEKEEMREHWDVYCATLKIDKNTKMFVKWEPGDEFKVCRMIFAVTLDIKVTRGPTVKTMEDKFFEQMGNHVKHLTSQQRLEKIKETLGSILDDEVIKSTDFKRFEHIFTKGMFYATEYRLFVHMLQNNPQKRSVLEAMFESGEWSKFITASRAYYCYLFEKRKSGYPETSFSNWFVNYVLNTCMFWQMYNYVFNTDPFELFETKTVQVGDYVPSDWAYHPVKIHKLLDGDRLYTQEEIREPLKCLHRRMDDLGSRLDLESLNITGSFLKRLSGETGDLTTYEDLNLYDLRRRGIENYLQVYGPMNEKQLEQYNDYRKQLESESYLRLEKFSADEKGAAWKDFVTWAETYGYLSRRVFEGDDGIFIVKKEYSNLVNDFYQMVGVVVKSETHEKLNTASFCGLVFDDEGILFRDPISTIAKFPILDAKYCRVNDNKMKALLRIKAMSLMSENPGCPILNVYALSVMRATEWQRDNANKYMKANWFRSTLSSYEYEQFMLNCGDIYKDWYASYKRPSHTTFLQFSKTYNLDIDMVIDCHNTFERYAFAPTVKSLRFPVHNIFRDSSPIEWKYYTDNYCFAKNPRDICHVFLKYKKEYDTLFPRAEDGYKHIAFQPRKPVSGEDRKSFLNSFV